MSAQMAQLKTDCVMEVRDRLVEIGDLDLRRNLKIRAFLHLVLAPVFRDMQPKLRYAEMGGRGITPMQYFQDFRNYPAPFGYGNPAPVFLAKQLELVEPPEMRNEKHLFLRLRSGGRTLRVKAWNFATRAGEFIPGARIDAALQFEEDLYSASRGYAPWQTILKDVRPAEAAVGQG